MKNLCLLLQIMIGESERVKQLQENLSKKKKRNVLIEDKFYQSNDLAFDIDVRKENVQRDKHSHEIEAKRNEVNVEEESSDSNLRVGDVQIVSNKCLDNQEFVFNETVVEKENCENMLLQPMDSISTTTCNTNSLKSSVLQEKQKYFIKGEKEDENDLAAIRSLFEQYTVNTKGLGKVEAEDVRKLKSMFRLLIFLSCNTIASKKARRYYEKDLEMSESTVFSIINNSNKHFIKKNTELINEINSCLCEIVKKRKFEKMEDDVKCTKQKKGDCFVQKTDSVLLAYHVLLKHDMIPIKKD